MLSSRTGKGRHRAHENETPTDHWASWTEDQTTTTYEPGHLGSFPGDAVACVAWNPALRFASVRVPEELTFSGWRPAAHSGVPTPRARLQHPVETYLAERGDDTLAEPLANTLSLCLASLVAGAGLFGAVLLGQVVLKASSEPTSVHATQSLSTADAVDSVPADEDTP
jgi:hypothetical protein